jgi:hypothetical protein
MKQSAIKVGTNLPISTDPIIGVSTSPPFLGDPLAPYQLDALQLFPHVFPIDFQSFPMNFLTYSLDI